ncbi:MAG: calcium/sodium antiporter [bacterium]
MSIQAMFRSHVRRAPELVLFLCSLLVLGVSYAVIGSEPGSSAGMLVAQAVLFASTIPIIAVGADWLVTAAARIADALGMSQLMIGLTIVAFGTSAPEGAVSLVAGFQGKGDITIANVVGSNIFNLCFILGGMTLISPGGLPVRREMTNRDTPILFLATVLLFFFVGGISAASGQAGGGFGFSGLRLLNLRLEFGEGIILVGALVIYLTYLYRVRKRDARSSRFTHHWGDGDPAQQTPDQPLTESQASEPGRAGEGSTLRDVGLFLLGLFVVVAGCDLLVGNAEAVEGGFRGLGAVWFAKQLGISDYVIGVTIVAAGTSTPEFVVSLVAALRGRFDMTIGNLIGSDLFNMLGVVGLAGIVLQRPLAPPVTVEPAAIGSLLALCALVALTWMFMRTGDRLLRWEGGVLVAIGVGRWVLDFAFQQTPPA